MADLPSKSDDSEQPKKLSWHKWTIRQFANVDAETKEGLQNFLTVTAVVSFIISTITVTVVTIKDYLPSIFSIPSDVFTVGLFAVNFATYARLVKSSTKLMIVEYGKLARFFVFWSMVQYLSFFAFVAYYAYKAYGYYSSNDIPWTIVSGLTSCILFFVTIWALATAVGSYLSVIITATGMTLRSENNSMRVETSAQISGIQSNLDLISEELKSLQKVADEQSKWITSFSGEIDDLNRWSRPLNSNVQTFKERLDVYNQKVETFSRDLNLLKNKVDVVADDPSFIVNMDDGSLEVTDAFFEKICHSYRGYANPQARSAATKKSLGMFMMLSKSLGAAQKQNLKSEFKEKFEFYLNDKLSDKDDVFRIVDFAFDIVCTEIGSPK